MLKTISRMKYLFFIACLLVIVTITVWKYSHSADTSEKQNFLDISDEVQGKEAVTELPDGNEVFLQSEEQLKLIEEKTIPHEQSTDRIYTYEIIGKSGAIVTLTKRELPNGDAFLFTELRNDSSSKIRVDVVQVQDGIDSSVFTPFRRIPTEEEQQAAGDRMTSSPAGLLKTERDGGISDQLVSKSYRSRELEISYAKGSSKTRELLSEDDRFTNMTLGDRRLTVASLESFGGDVVDQWTLSSSTKLFSNETEEEAWMHEFVLHNNKRNKWYTAEGAYNKMADTVEPIGKNGQAYGRNLLMMKEDRALLLYERTGERLYEDLLHNAFVNLEQFRGDTVYWETEVTSTYLKDLYGFTAPFIDTRFNEQIALFLKKGKVELGYDDADEGLRNYADLLVSQTQKGNVSRLQYGAYYIPDYFPVDQEALTHTSMNHLLGGMNILLSAYKEFGDPVYLETAAAIVEAIELDERNWIRDDGDIWYKRSPDGEFIGRDYTHLTLEDLIFSYENWMAVDETKTGVFKQMIESKAAYLDSNQLGYTVKIKEGLQRIGMMDLLPDGFEYTDAL